MPIRVICSKCGYIFIKTYDPDEYLNFLKVIKDAKKRGINKCPRCGKRIELPIKIEVYAINKK